MLGATATCCTRVSVANLKSRLQSRVGSGDETNINVTANDVSTSQLPKHSNIKKAPQIMKAHSQQVQTNTQLQTTKERFRKNKVSTPSRFKSLSDGLLIYYDVHWAATYESVTEMS